MTSATPDDLIDAAAAEVRKALDELVKGLRDAIKLLQERLETAEGERDEAIRERDELREEIAALEKGENDALQTVKYWMHDVLVLGKPMSDPRKILRTVEEALEK